MSPHKSQITDTRAQAPEFFVPTFPQQISYTPEQAAVATGRSRSRIFKAIKDEELTARKDGKATIIEVAELARWVSSLRTRGRQQESVAA